MSATNDMPPIVPDEVQDDALTPPPGFGKPLGEMSDREIAEETLYQLRSVAVMVGEFQQFVANMGPGDIMKMLLGGKKN